MLTVTFFGHRDTPQEIQSVLKNTLMDLIEKHGAVRFYVGNQGSFDRITGATLLSLKLMYPQIIPLEVLAYRPGEKEKAEPANHLEKIYPLGLEKTPPKYAISKRNRWMVEQADIVITYVTHTTGGAAQFKKLAEKKGKHVINLPEL